MTRYLKELSILTLSRICHVSLNVDLVTKNLFGFDLMEKTETGNMWSLKFCKDIDSCHHSIPTIFVN